MSDRPAIEQFVTFVYCVDLARAARFYEDVIGLDMMLDQGTCRIYRVAGDAYIGICQRVDVRGPFSDDVILTLVSQDVDGWYEHLLAAGSRSTSRRNWTRTTISTTYSLATRTAIWSSSKLSATRPGPSPSDSFRISVTVY